MTDATKTEIVAVVDRSGSMISIARAMETGFQKFVDEQKRLPGECLWSVYKFDTEHQTVFEGKPSNQVPPLVIEPRGGTALLDGVNLAIGRLGERLAALPESQRPGAVIVLVITDGHENASHEVTRDQLRARIEEQQSKYGWKFVYLGADSSAFSEAASLGVAHSASYSANTRGVSDMYVSASKGISSYRSAVANNNADAQLNIESTGEPANTNVDDPLDVNALNQALDANAVNQALGAKSTRVTSRSHKH